MRLWPRRSEERTLVIPRDLQPPWIYYPAPAASVDASGALMNVNVWACTRVLADTAMSCPLLTYRRDVGGSRRRAGGRTSDLLERPGEDTTQAGLIGTVMEHLVLWGNAYLGKYRDGDGRIEQLIAIPPPQVQLELRNGRVVFTVTGAGTGQLTEHGLDDIVHIKGLSTDGLVGLSPIGQVRTALVLDDATRAASTSLFVNNGRPSGILTMEHASQDQAELLKAQWMGKHGGDNAGGIAVLSGEISFQALAMPPDDAQYVEARKLSATEIARAFRVPPWMIGASDDSSMTYSNTESQALSFVVFSLQPWLRAIEQALSNDRDLFGPSTYCEFLIDGLLRADSRTRAEIYEKALNPVTGWMRRDEVRRLENLEPEPDTAATQDTPVNTNGQGALA